MKSLFLIVVVLMAFPPVIFAQQFENESEFYAKTVFINKIYADIDGYRIDYIKTGFSLASFWAPREWFSGNDSIGTIVTGEGAAYPYMTLFFKDGVVNHFRIYAPISRTHPSWSVLERGRNYSPEYPPADSRPEIEF